MNVLGFDSQKVNKPCVFLSRAWFADILGSACNTKFISTLVCPTLKKYRSFHINIGGVLSIPESTGVNCTGGLKFFSRFLLGSCSTCNFEDHSLIFIIIIKQILASDYLVLSNDSFSYTFTYLLPKKF